jgi:hypothetical protein
MRKSTIGKRMTRAIMAGLTMLSGAAVMGYGCGGDFGYYDSYGYDYYGYDYYGGYGPIDHEDFIDYIRS